MAIYTRRGDWGKTSLYNGKRQWKNDRRVIALGGVDELNSQLGFASSLLSRRAKKLEGIIRRIQQDLFEIATELAIPQGKKTPFSMTTRRVKEIERMVDSLEGKLAALGSFIFPGGSTAAASLHVGRSVCRRVEREIVALSRKEKVNPKILMYLNRLSDLLFLLARKINQIEKAPEEVWRK